MALLRTIRAAFSPRSPAIPIEVVLAAMLDGAAELDRVRGATP